MKKRIILSIAGIASLVIVFFAGFAVGSRWTFSWMLDFQRAEVVGNLNLMVEYLARIRTGDQSGAVEFMESRLDSGLATLPQESSWDDLPESTRKTLILLKAYRMKYPPKQPSEEFRKHIDFIPDSIEIPKYCSPAIQKALGQIIDRKDTT